MVFSYGDAIYSLDEPPKGIYIVVSGLVKLEYVPSAAILEVNVSLLFSYIHYTSTNKDLKWFSWHNSEFRTVRFLSQFGSAERFNI